MLGEGTEAEFLIWKKAEYMHDLTTQVRKTILSYKGQVESEWAIKLSELIIY